MLFFVVFKIEARIKKRAAWGILYTKQFKSLSAGWCEFTVTLFILLIFTFYMCFLSRTKGKGVYILNVYSFESKWYLIGKKLFELDWEKVVYWSLYAPVNTLFESNLYEATTLGTTQNWLSWADGCLIKQLHKIIRNQIWQFLAGFRFFFPL